MDDKPRGEKWGPASTPPDAPRPGERDSLPDAQTPAKTPAVVLRIGPLPPWVPRPRRRRPRRSAPAGAAPTDLAPAKRERNATESTDKSAMTGAGGGTPAERLPEIREWWHIVTLTGSRYVVARDHTGQWWFGATNMPNSGSGLLPPGYWRIKKPTPWPPVIGLSVRLLAPSDLPWGHPARAPGGGRTTSIVRRVERIPAAPEGC